MDAKGFAFFRSLVILVGSFTGDATIIPLTFPQQDVSSYTIRYLSQTHGSDVEACHSNQSYLAPLANVSACQSLGYAIIKLTPEEEGSNKVFGFNNTIVLVSPGVYSYGGSGGIEIHESSGVILAKDPRYEGEVVFSCESLNETNLNNLFFYQVKHVALVGITGVKCGLLNANVVFQLCTSITVSQCTFRQVVMCLYFVMNV